MTRVQFTDDYGEALAPIRIDCLAGVIGVD
jgi:hypothetical protein